MRRALALAALLAACSDDPCAAHGGTCVALTVTSASIASLDRLRITDDRLATTRESVSPTPLSLPLVLAVTLPPGAGGHVVLHVVGARLGVDLGSGDAITDVAEGGHASATASLVAIAGNDLGMPGDLAGADFAVLPDLATADLTGVSCTPGQPVGCADAMTLQLCGAGDMLSNVACPLGCGTAGGPHCKVFVPSGAVTTADLTAAGTGAITLNTDAQMNGDTGAFTGSVGAISGASYHLAGNVAVFSVASLTVGNSAVLRLFGSHPIAIVASGDITVNGTIDARGYTPALVLCVNGVAGPGGGAGGMVANGAGAGNAPGSGGGVSGANSWGGGGGGFGDIGGASGAFNGSAAAAGGVYGTPELVPLVGGSGGGAADSVANGGGGGGAIQLVAAGQIIIGGGTGPGGVNAGGCGGRGGNAPTGAGGGGGSGGAILLEAPLVQLASTGILAANGAGGSVCGTGQATPGQLDAIPSPGLTNPGVSAPAGNGGAGPIIAGQSGSPSASLSTGGGGGGVGRIRVNTLGAALSPAVGFIISPSFTQLGSTGKAAATLGAISTQ